MKLFSFFLRHFYSIEVRTTEAQLRLDFGDFPPVPLHNDLRGGQFKVIRTRGIGDVYYELSRLRKFIDALVSAPQSLTHECLQEFGADAAQSLRIQHESMKLYPGFVKSTLLALTLVIMGLRLIVRRVVTKPRGMGVFTPLFNDESNIIIRSDRFNGKSDEDVVTHEHIHLLQHRYPERFSRHIKCPELHVSEKYLSAGSRGTALYLLEKMEVEARLHESVLSFYRANRQLPNTVPAFLGLLASSPKYGWYVSRVFTLRGVTFDKVTAPYTDRDSMFVDQLESTMLMTMDDEYKGRFLTEVLTVMYGNLIRYYGDSAASCAFLANIPRPNYYDELYGI